MQLTKEQIKNFQIKSLGLFRSPEKKATKEDLIKVIQQMGVLQIDTIHVVARSPYLTIWSRLGDYKPHWLEEVHADGKLFEYWAHAACFIPIEDYPLFRPAMQNGRHDWRNSDKWYHEHKETVEHVLETIKMNGPTRSADFKREKKGKSGWWNWKEEKIAMENLWTRGDLMVAFRKSFQRYYDFTDRVLPDVNQLPRFDYNSAVREFISKTVFYLGVARKKWIADYYRLDKGDVNAMVPELVTQGILIEIPCEEWSENVLVHKDQFVALQAFLDSNQQPDHTTLLSPFDPLIWDRDRTRDLFNFDFALECYLPVPKRKYGYFSLPILHKGNLVGRLDAKAHRKEKIFEIKSCFFEDWFSPDEEFFNVFSKMLQSCADWHKTPEVLFRQSQPAFIKEKVNSLM